MSYNVNCNLRHGLSLSATVTMDFITLQGKTLYILVEKVLSFYILTSPSKPVVSFIVALFIKI